MPPESHRAGFRAVPLGGSQRCRGSVSTAVEDLTLLCPQDMQRVTGVTLELSIFFFMRLIYSLLLSGIVAPSSIVASSHVWLFKLASSKV